MNVCCANSGNEVSELLTVDNKVRITLQPDVTHGLALVRAVQLYEQGRRLLQEEREQDHSDTSLRAWDIDSKKIGQPAEGHEFASGLYVWPPA